MANVEQAHAIAEMILTNLASESKARKQQQELLSLPGLDSADIFTIKEISSDESNHALLYEAMFKKYSGITAASDGAAKALASISEGIKSGDG